MASAKLQGLLNKVLLDWLRESEGICYILLPEEILGLYDKENCEYKDIIPLQISGVSEEYLYDRVSELKRVVYKSIYSSFIFSSSSAISFHIEKDINKDNVYNLVIIRNFSSNDYLVLESLICFCIQKSYLAKVDRVYAVSGCIELLTNIKTSYYETK